MQYRQLGRAGVRVSAIGLGSYLTLGMSVGEDIGAVMVRKSLDLGINFIDTADAYNAGQAEEALARYLAGVKRSDIVLATKAYAPMGPNTNDRGLSAKHLLESCDKSLRRLSTDYIDLYQCHRPDLSVPLEETVRVMDDLRRRGKIIYWGASEWPAWLICEAIGIAQRHGWLPPVSNQPRYSLYYRQPEMELWPFCQRHGIGNVVFSPLAHGMLTAKYKPGEEAAPGTRAADPRQSGVIRKMYWNEENLRKSQQFAQIAEGMGVRPSQLALAWVLRRSEVSSAIIGASKVEQVEENVAAAEVKVPDDVLKQLDAIFPAPAVTYPAG